MTRNRSGNDKSSSVNNILHISLHWANMENDLCRGFVYRTIYGIMTTLFLSGHKRGKCIFWKIGVTASPPPDLAFYSYIMPVCIYVCPNSRLCVRSCCCWRVFSLSCSSSSHCLLFLLFSGVVSLSLSWGKQGVEKQGWFATCVTLLDKAWIDVTCW